MQYAFHMLNFTNNCAILTLSVTTIFAIRQNLQNAINNTLMSTFLWCFLSYSIQEEKKTKIVTKLWANNIFSANTSQKNIGKYLTKIASNEMQLNAMMTIWKRICYFFFHESRKISITLTQQYNRQYVTIKYFSNYINPQCPQQSLHKQ